MHELSIAMSILEVASDEAMRQGVDVVAIRVKIGPLAGVVSAALQSAFEVAREGTELPKLRLVIEETPLIVFCSECKVERRLASPQKMCCPTCGAPTPNVISGRELDVVALEVADLRATAPG